MPQNSNGFSPHGQDMFGEIVYNHHGSILGTAFLVPPFSVLNAREGWWQERKSAWLALGIKSEIGRGDTAGSKLTMSDTIQRLKPSADPATKSARAASAIPGGTRGLTAFGSSGGAHE